MRRWYIINDQNNRQYGRGDDSTVKYNTETIKPHLCDYCDAYILEAGNIEVANGNDNTKDCSPFTRCVLHLNNKPVETAEIWIFS